MKFLNWFLASILFAIGMRAQQFDNPVTIPVNLFGHSVVTTAGSNTYYHFGQALGANVDAEASNSPPGTHVYTILNTVGLIPGKVYTDTVTAVGFSTVEVHFPKTPGIQTYVNGVKGDTAAVTISGGSGTYTVRVEATSDVTSTLATKRGGECTTLPDDKAIWYIGLGHMRNGDVAGALGFRSATIPAPGSNPSLFNSSGLLCDTSDDTEVAVTRDANGFITRVQSREVVITVDPYVASSTSYSIYVYTPAEQLNPYIKYTISQYSVTGGNGLRIDKLEDGVNWSTLLTHVGTTWTRYDWQKLAASNPAFDATHKAVTTYDSGIGAWNTDLGGVLSKRKTFDSVTGELTALTWGPGVSPVQTTSYTYWQFVPTGSWPGSVQNVIEPTGNWTRYDYYNNGPNNDQNDSRAGQVAHIYKPWLDTLSDPSQATLSNCYVESYDYGTDYTGDNTAMTSKVVSVNGTTIAKSAWSYNWNYGNTTVTEWSSSQGANVNNSHVIAQKIEEDYSDANDYVKTVTLAYRPDDSNSFFWNKPYSVTYPNGRKDAYAYFYGTWSSTARTFTADTQGNDRLTMVFHGQTSGGGFRFQLCE